MFLAAPQRKPCEIQILPELSSDIGRLGQLWAGKKDGRLLGRALFKAIPPLNSKDGIAKRCCWFFKSSGHDVFIPIEHEKTKFGQIKFHDNEVEQIDLTRYEIGLHG